MTFSVLGPVQSALPAGSKGPTSWTVGQFLHATVLQRLSVGNIVVSIGGDKLRASTSANLAPGQSVLLRVSALSPQPLLHVVSSTASGLAGGSRAGTVAAEYLSSGLPQLLNSLSWLTRGQESLLRTLPPVVRSLALDVLSAIPTPEKLIVPSSLQRVLQNAGLLLEARLAHSLRGLAVGSEIALDFKARLLRLQRAIGQHVKPLAHGAGTNASGLDAAHAGQIGSSSPRGLPLDITEGFLQRLFTTVEAAVQRIEARQLAAIASGARQVFAWQVEIPFLCGDRVRTVEFVIEGDVHPSDPEHASGWTVHVGFDADELGAIHARVRLVGQRIAVQFWAAQPMTFALLLDRVGALENGLVGLGLSVTGIQCIPGMPAGVSPDDGCLIQVHA